jgi:ubiquinone/menaquinone biosynthesis C-methylase UbiE
MTLSTSDWHQRYLQQARWTQNLRIYIYNQVGFQRANKILDIGCGTGVLENELNSLTSARVYGLDIDPDPLHMAKNYAPKSNYTGGDCLALPFRNNEFDISLCHFLLLWVRDALKAISEMMRVTRPNGFVLALAEPDYGGRIDYPGELSLIGFWQIDALKQQGANPLIGRELKSLFSQAGLENLEVGVLGGQWKENEPIQDTDLEWDVIQSDLYQNIEFINQADRLRTIETASRETHQRILFVPTFYVVGMVPEVS